MNITNPYFSYKIIENKNLLDFEHPQTRKRTLRERWFSFPWRPWIKNITYYNPDPNCYVMNNFRSIVCHSIVAKKLKMAMEKN